jgi:hypothetical protein
MLGKENCSMCIFNYKICKNVPLFRDSKGWIWQFHFFLGSNGILMYIKKMLWKPLQKTVSQGPWAAE